MGKRFVQKVPIFPSQKCYKTNTNFNRLFQSAEMNKIKCYFLIK